MHRLAILVLLAASGCLRSNGTFHCSSDADCARGGAAGTCELVGFCSFADSSCPSGARYGELSGQASNQCVTSGDIDAGVDSPRDADAAPPTPPTFLVAASTNAGSTDRLTYALDIPSATNRFLVVLVQIPSNCSTIDPSVSTVTFNGIAMTQIASVLGTPCGPTVTRSEQWGLVAPATGPHDIEIKLDGPAPYTLLSGALAFANVSQTTPVRMTATTSGSGTSAFLDVPSQPMDLVVSTVGFGGAGITGPGTGEDLRYLLNVDSSNTLNNTAAGTKIALATSTTMTWTFGNLDEYQLISTVLRSN